VSDIKKTYMPTKSTPKKSDLFEKELESPRISQTSLPEISAIVGKSNNKGFEPHYSPDPSFVN
jgi:hypothetical protein